MNTSTKIKKISKRGFTRYEELTNLQQEISKLNNTVRELDKQRKALQAEIYAEFGEENDLKLDSRTVLHRNLVQVAEHTVQAYRYYKLTEEILQ